MQYSEFVTALKKIGFQFCIEGGFEETLIDTCTVEQGEFLQDSAPCIEIYGETDITFLPSSGCPCCQGKPSEKHEKFSKEINKLIDGTLEGFSANAGQIYPLMKALTDSVYEEAMKKV